MIALASRPPARPHRKLPRVVLDCSGCSAPRPDSRGVCEHCGGDVEAYVPRRIADLVEVVTPVTPPPAAPVQIQECAPEPSAGCPRCSGVTDRALASLRRPVQLGPVVVWQDGRVDAPVHLTPQEMRLLAVLVRWAPRAAPYGAVGDALGLHEQLTRSDAHVLTVHKGRLRAKLRPHGLEIVTEPFEGYRIVEAEEEGGREWRA